MKKQILAAVGGILLTATLTAGAQFVVRIGPPPPRPVEVAPPPPRPNVEWVPGFHRWDGHGYVWVPGHYADRPYAHAHWVEGHWVNHGGGYVWHEGHWSH